jgi:hypothetical protein
MNELESDRVRAVELLWALKRACDERDRAEVPLVHFRLLLDDPGYRAQVVRKALVLEDEAISAIARELLERIEAGRIPDDLSGDARKRQRAEASGAARPAAGGVAGPPAADAEAAGPKRPLTHRLVPVALAGVMLTASALLYGLSGSSEVAVRAPITEDTKWRAGKTYVLQNPIFVEGGATLTIEPGVTVRGRPGSALIVTRDARIFARGTRDAPIVMTSAESEGQRAAGDWGGLVLLGRAPLNVGESQLEGVAATDDRGHFGGSDAQHNCGVLEYVRIEFAGFELARNVELNGLTLGGCGEATVVRHVQVHRGLDDGIEVFGGNVHLSRVLVTGPDDDGLDWDLGWRGRAQFVIVQMYPNIGDSAIEADNLASDHDASPRSAPQIANATLLADRASRRSHRAMTLRRGSAGDFRNFLISGFNDETIDLRDEGVGELVASRALQFAAIGVHDSGPTVDSPFPDEQGEADDDAGFSERAYFLESGRAQPLARSGLSLDAGSTRAPDFVPREPPPKATAAALPQGEFWDEGASFLGAIDPVLKQDWTLGWAAYPLH